MTITSADQAHQYQRWRRTPGESHWTWPAIVVNGIASALKNVKTRTLLLTAGMPALGAVVLFYVLSVLEAIAGTPDAAGLVNMFRVLLHVDITGMLQMAELRDVLWRCIFLAITKLQMFWVLIVVARVGTGLIAGDLKARALPIYFSKPVTPATYLLGKWAVVASFVALVLLIPNLAALTLGTFFTGGPGSWAQILRLAFDLLVSGILVCVVAGAIILALSSVTSDYRYVTVGWLAICLLPIAAQRIIHESLPRDLTTGWLGCISLRDDVILLIERILHIREGLAATSLPGERFERALGNPVAASKALIVLGTLTAAAILFSWRRVVRFSRMASTV